jgi:hypothetical protein
MGNIHLQNIMLGVVLVILKRGTHKRQKFHPPEGSPVGRIDLEISFGGYETQYSLKIYLSVLAEKDGRP